MQTPYLPKALFSNDFNNVYEPAEDTFLLLDALEEDLHQLRSDVKICVEFGSGSGTVITALSKALGQDRLFLSTDINHQACSTTLKCAAYHGQTNIQAVNTNLAESLVDRLANSVDLMIFNPPYVPTEEGEVLADSELIQHSWAGGARGRKLTDIFLNSYVPQMMSQPRGVTYMVALHANDVHELKNLLRKEHKICGKVVMSRRAGPELLSIIKYQWVDVTS